MSRPEDSGSETEPAGEEAESADAPEPVTPPIDEDVAGSVNAAVHDADDAAKGKSHRRPFRPRHLEPEREGHDRAADERAALLARRLREQEPEHRAEERVRGDLVGEDPSVAKERRPHSGATIRVDAVDDCHRRPERHVLDLGGERALQRPAPAQALEAGPEHRSVAEVERQRRGRASSSESGEEPAVGVRGSEEPS